MTRNGSLADRAVPCILPMWPASRAGCFRLVHDLVYCQREQGIKRADVGRRIFLSSLMLPSARSFFGTELDGLGDGCGRRIPWLLLL